MPEISRFFAISSRDAEAPLPPPIDDLELVATPPSHHRHPFDRLMIAQSSLQQIPVISDDRVFDEYGVERRW